MIDYIDLNLPIEKAALEKLNPGKEIYLCLSKDQIDGYKLKARNELATLLRQREEQETTQQEKTESGKPPHPEEEKDLNYYFLETFKKMKENDKHYLFISGDLDSRDGDFDPYIEDMSVFLQGYEGKIDGLTEVYKKVEIEIDDNSNRGEGKRKKYTITGYWGVGEDGKDKFIPDVDIQGIKDVEKYTSYSMNKQNELIPRTKTLSSDEFMKRLLQKSLEELEKKRKTEKPTGSSSLSEAA
jgi:hypothetical protein